MKNKKLNVKRKKTYKHGIMCKLFCNFADKYNTYGLVNKFIYKSRRRRTYSTAIFDCHRFWCLLRENKNRRSFPWRNLCTICRDSCRTHRLYGAIAHTHIPTGLWTYPIRIYDRSTGRSGLFRELRKGRITIEHAILPCYPSQCIGNVRVLLPVL